MSTSTSPLASPGTWQRIEPISGKTAPGFIGDGTTLAHGDLASIGGSNPSIIRDQENAIWHMVYGKWGGGLAYTNSTDLHRWETPYLICEGGDETPNTQYPTLVGDEGDTLTTNGAASLYFTAANTVDWGRPLCSVDIDFGSDGGGSSAGNSSLPTMSVSPSSSVATNATSSVASQTSATTPGGPTEDENDDECDAEQ